MTRTDHLRGDTLAAQVEKLLSSDTGAFRLHDHVMLFGLAEIGSDGLLHDPALIQARAGSTMGQRSHQGVALPIGNVRR